MKTLLPRALGSAGTMIICAALSLLPATGAAQPLGPEFRVNSYTSFTQWYPVVTSISDVGFVVVWGESDDFQAQLLNVAGQAHGAQFRVNTTYTGFGPAVASDAAGNFVVTWQTNPGQDVAARRFTALGTPLGNDFRVNTYTTGQQGSPHVTTFGAGKFVIAWRDYLGLPSNPDVNVQLFLANGAALGGELRVNTATTERQNDLDVAGAPDQGFVVVFQDASAPGLFNVTAQRFDAAGAPVAAPFRVNTTTSQSVSPRASMDLTGRFVVVWESGNGDGNLYGVFGRRFAANGTPLGPEFLVNGISTGKQWQPDVAMDNEGAFMVVWQDDTADGSSNSIFGRRYSSTGEPLGGSAIVNTYTTLSQQVPSVSAAGRGFVVTWMSDEQDGSDNGIFARRYCLLKGDVNGDGAVTVSDILYMINRLFAGGPAPLGCPDVNADDAFNVSDILYLINFLFAGGAPPV